MSFKRHTYKVIYFVTRNQRAYICSTDRWQRFVENDSQITGITDLTGQVVLEPKKISGIINQSVLLKQAQHFLWH